MPKPHLRPWRRGRPRKYQTRRYRIAWLIETRGPMIPRAWFTKRNHYYMPMVMLSRRWWKIVERRRHAALAPAHGQETGT